MMYDKLSMQLLPFDRTGIRKRFRSNLTPSCRLCASSRYYPSQAGPFTGSWQAIISLIFCIGKDGLLLDELTGIFQGCDSCCLVIVL
jgi:hypothetical protein